MKKIVALALMSCTLPPALVRAEETQPPEETGSETAATGADRIIVTGARAETFAGTKTDTPLIETPQPITIVSADQFLSQGAINISDTVRYAAGITAGPYGRDTRADGFVIRGIDALQFRDGMRDIFSYFASITSDPYNFSRVEIVRGPASVLFGQGSIGGLVNLVSKTPDFETRGEISAVYGSFDRKELLGDVNLAISDTFAIRAVGRARDAGTYVDHVPDDRVMFAPSLRWRPTPDTDITLLGLYQEDDGGSTAQFLPVVGTLLPNGDRPKLDDYLFVGKPGWDRYSGRLLQGGGSITQRFGEHVQLSLKARYIDSDLTYYTHYANFYYPVTPGGSDVPDPQQPYLDGVGGRLISWAREAGDARLNVFSTDNNLQFKFGTGNAVQHTLLVGLDYSWNKVGKRYAADPNPVETLDIYDIDYDALQTPEVSGPFFYESQKQLGIYLQDQIRLWDRVSVVLGARRDRVETRGGAVDKATTFRAGIIGEIGAGISPFFSYTESFQPIAGSNRNGDPFRPQRGTQYETGLKWQPDLYSLVTVTAFHIKETGRPIPSPTNPLDRIQSGELTTKGIEIEASRTLPDNFELLASYGYNKLTADNSASFNYMPRHTASLWSTKTFGLPESATLRLGAGVRYTGSRRSVTPGWTLVTPDNVQVDALAEIERDKWRLALNVTNLLNGTFYASCLTRGDCFVNAPRNVMGTIGYRF